MPTPDVEKVISSLDQISAQSLGDEIDAGARLIEAARRMIARLESPFTQMFHLFQVPGHVAVALRILADIGLWKAWCEADGKDATLMELWEMCKVPCDSVLLRKDTCPGV